MATLSTPRQRFFNANGLKLHFLEWGNADAPAIVCIHGLSGNAHNFDNLASRFSDRFRVLCIDVRGRGDSDWSSQGAYTVDDYVSDLESFIEFVGLEKFSLIGISMGARIAMHYAASHSDRLKHLVLDDIGPEDEKGPGMDRIIQNGATRPDSFSSIEEATAYRARTLPSFSRLTASEQLERISHDVREHNGRWVFKNDPLSLKAVRANVEGEATPRLWQVLQALPCPSLVVWGTESEILSGAQARRMVETMTSAELVVVKGSPHAPSLSEPEAVDALEQLFTEANWEPSMAAAPNA